MTTFTAAISRFICLMIISMLGGAGASAYELPGIPSSGSPSFESLVEINFKKDRLTITGKKDFLFDNSQQLFQGNSSKYTLSVDFDKNTGAFLGGSLSFRGGIDALGIPGNETLVTADIINLNLNGTQSGVPLPGGGFDLWGFATDNIVCSPLLLISCTQRESIYIELDEPFSGEFGSKIKFGTMGTAITTVPLPAAAGFFGSALGLLVWLRRRGGYRLSGEHDSMPDIPGEES
jgi:hypothetical protein